MSTRYKTSLERSVIGCLIVFSLVHMGCSRNPSKMQNTDLGQRQKALEFWYHATTNAPVTISVYSLTVTYREIEAILCGRLDRNEKCPLILHVEPGMDISVTYPLLNLAARYGVTNIQILRDNQYPDKWMKEKQLGATTPVPDYIYEQ